MRAIFLCGIFLGLAACGRKQPKPEAESEVHLPRRTTTVAVEPPGPDSITITLTGDGRILARGRAWSLAGLDGLLKEVVRRDGRYYGSTVVRLRIDRAVPWLHVRWLVYTLMECFVHEIRLVYQDSALGEADVRSTVSSVIGEPSTFVEVVRLRVVVDTRGRIRCGDRMAEDPAAVGAWTAEAAARGRKDGLSGIRSEIAPWDGTTWGAIAAVYERLRSADGAPVRFAGGHMSP